MNYLHIHCGDSSADTLRNSVISGDVLVWREIYVEGPVPGNLSEEEFIKIRAKFISNSTGLDYGRVLQGSKERYKQLVEAGKYDEVILWFDACMFDQTIMVHLIDRCVKQNWTNTTISLICIGKFPGFKRFCGLGELNSEQMASLFEKRYEITIDEIQLAKNAWKAFTSDNPREMEKLISENGSPFSYLKQALIRHLEQFPSVGNGLSRLQNQVLKVVDSGQNNLVKIFRETSNLEERPFFGETSLWNVIQEMSNVNVPVLKISGPGDFSELIKLNPEYHNESSSEKLGKWHVSITDTGRDILASKQDYIKLNGINKWLGGVYLRGDESKWRWDSKNKILHECTVS